MNTTCRPSVVARRLILLLAAGTCLAQEDRDITLDQMNSAGDEAAAKAIASVVSGASHPLSLSGDALLKIQGHLFTQCPEWLEGDKSWIEPSESKFALKMKIRPNRHAIIFTGMGFNVGRMAGTGLPNPLSPGNDALLNYDSIPFVKNFVMDNTTSGVAILAGDATVWLRMGGVIWVQSSPLSVWGGDGDIRMADTKRYAWDYLPWEDEKPVTQYYFDRTIKGESVGEAADRWNKKPFKGINLETEGLPGNVYVNLVYAQPEVLEYGYGRSSLGLGNFNFLHGRVSKASKDRTAGVLTLGLNWANMFYGENVTRYNSYETWNPKFRDYWGIGTKGGQGMYRNHHVATVDLKGMLAEHTQVTFELGTGIRDEVTVVVDSAGLERKSSDFKPPVVAVYGKIRDENLAPLQLEFAYVPKRYYSFSNYGINSAGGNLSYLPKVDFGKIRFSYGQRRELEPSMDLIYLPYRLNGPDFQTMLYGTYARFAGSRMDRLYQNKYQARAGDESARGQPDPMTDPLTGGIRGDFQNTWETFVAYDSLDQFKSMFFDPVIDTLSDVDKRIYESPYVPRHSKWKFMMNWDYSLDVSKLLNVSRKVLLVGEVMLDGTSRTFKPIALSQKDMQLWGLYTRIEPAVAITPEFYVTFLYGFEWWKSDMSYMILGSAGNYQYENVPIDYRDQALGIGFDWDMSRRVGLHVRYKATHHDDVNWKPNNYMNHFGYGLVKVWF